MYRACIHCCQDLGQNEVIEPFPIGRRLAFDSAKGRLWVVCPHCGRWNLTPLEERWEAVEECERRFRGLRLRAQTSNIGLAKLSEGPELVRIGKPLRPEFAAWRYGREFSRRHTRYILGATAVGLAAAGVVAAGVYAGPIALVLPHTSYFLYTIVRDSLPIGSSITLPRGPGRTWQVESNDTMILPDPSGWHLSIRHHFGRAELTGDEARRWLSYLMARVNRSGGSESLVADAVRQIEAAPLESFIASIAEESAQLWEVDREKRRVYDKKLNEDLLSLSAGRAYPSPPTNRASLWHLPDERRLALEMALHESTEQRAIDGDLAALEAAWREAEEIAGIADDLLLPESIRARVAEAHGETRSKSGRD